MRHKIRPNTILLFMVCGAMASCGKGNGSVPAGQVVATVDGKEITAAEMGLEMRDLAETPETRKAVVNALVARRLLVAEAERRKLGQGETASLARARARDLTLVDLLRRDIAAGAPASPSNAEIDRTLAQNADAFARRQLVTADQLLVSQPVNALVAGLGGVRSLDEAARALAAGNVPTNRARVVLDTLFLDPAASAALANASLGDIVVLPGNNGAGPRIVQVLDRQPAALLGPEARAAARALLARQSAERLRNRLEDIVKAGQKQVTLVSAGQS